MSVITYKTLVKFKPTHIKNCFLQAVVLRFLSMYSGNEKNHLYVLSNKNWFQ